MDNFRAMAELGLLGAFVPEDYGGAGMDLRVQSIPASALLGAIHHAGAPAGDP